MNRFDSLNPQQRQAKIRDKLDRLTDWTPQQLQDEFNSWPREEVTELWELLKPAFQGICHRFGVMRPSSRVERQGIRMHQQIRRLTVLEQVANGEKKT